jgi:pyruvate/2-oxoglutarate/acetoin dehydrogenase E1 component
MVKPPGPRTARALLVSAIRDHDPVIFFEPKLIYRRKKKHCLLASGGWFARGATSP